MECKKSVIRNISKNKAENKINTVFPLQKINKCSFDNRKRNGTKPEEMKKVKKKMKGHIEDEK